MVWVVQHVPRNLRKLPSRMSDADRRAFLREKFASDPLATDFQCGLLISAANSYRHDTVLRPFPPMFQKEVDGPEAEGKDYLNLKRTIKSLPGFHQLKEGNFESLDSSTLEFLQWTLNAKNFHLKSCAKDFFSEIKDKTQQVVSVPNPNFIFEVVYAENAENKFRERAGERELAYAYHGSRVDNFHSIVHYGLQGHMSKNALFGEGTYLSSDLSVSMPYAPNGHLWERSLVGDLVSCIAVCELISDDPAVKCQVKDQSSSEQGTSTRSRARVAGSLGGEVPEKYYVIRNNDVMRVKYILVYADRHKPKSVNASWFARHKFFVMIVLYALLLVAVGLYNSQIFRNYIRRLSRS